MYYERGYGLDYGLKHIDGPSSEPLSLADEKIHSRFNLGSPVDTEEQTYIERLFIASRRNVERSIFKPIGIQTFELSLPCFPYGYVLEFFNPPLIEVKYIRYMKQGETVATTLHDLTASPAIVSDIFITETGCTPGKIFLRSSKGWPSDSLESGYPVKIGFSAGLDMSLDENEGVMQLLRFAFAQYYENREPVTDGRVNPPFVVPNTYDDLVGKEQHWEMR